MWMTLDSYLSLPWIILDVVIRDKNIPVVNDRLAIAGVRLAFLLNAIFDKAKELPF